jgi:hypothetical protein
MYILNPDLKILTRKDEKCMGYRLQGAGCKVQGTGYRDCYRVQVAGHKESLQTCLHETCNL